MEWLNARIIGVIVDIVVVVVVVAAAAVVSWPALSLSFSLSCIALHCIAWRTYAGFSVLGS
jgi:hypothetical protein